MPDQPEAIQPCGICGHFSNQEYGFQKNGWPADDLYLPNGVGKLVLVRDLKPESARQLQLQQCPECGTYYLYSTDYEYLAGGSEDEQSLVRLTQEQAAEYLPPAAE